MAKQSGVLPLEGSFGDLSFYYHKTYGFLARRKGGAKNGKISERTRENASELSEASRTGKLIRYAVRAGLQFTGDETVTQRLTSVLSKVLRKDTVNVRGQRKVSEGIYHAESREELREFAFRDGAAFGSVVKKQVVYDAEAGSFTLAGLTPRIDLICPEAATHVRFRAMTAHADAASDTYAFAASETVVIGLDAVEEDVVLAAGLPQGSGFRVGFVKLVFLEEVNGDLYELAEGRCVGMVC